MLFSKSSKIGQYTVAFQHKQGANAETYRVKDAGGKTRFLKLINCNRLNRHQIDDNGRIVEIEIAKQLTHKNLCRFIDEGSITIDGCRYSYFVTEYVSGETLSQKIIREGKLSIYEIKEITKAVLSALDFLHSLPTPIIHNEVTIQNVMMSFTGDINDLKLIDFGHAKLINQPHAKPDLEVLNPFCLAPERFSGVCSPRTDIYAVGVMLYQLIYNELPWFFDVSRIEKSERVDALLSHREKELKLRHLDDVFELDDQLINCMLKALSYDAESLINSWIASINKQGQSFLRDYLRELSHATLSTQEQMQIVDFALKTIEADNKIEYSEIKFFKKIRLHLSIDDDMILAQHPDKEDFLLPDIIETEIPEWSNINFNNIKFDAK